MKGAKSILKSTKDIGKENCSKKVILRFSEDDETVESSEKHLLKAKAATTFLRRSELADQIIEKPFRNSRTRPRMKCMMAKSMPAIES